MRQGDQFTGPMRRAVELAGQEASQLSHPAVGDAHLLLGLLGERRGVVGRALRRNGVELVASREALRSGESPQQVDEEYVPQLDLSGRRALQVAMHESMARCNVGIHPTHLLLGIISVEGAAVSLITAQGAAPSKLVERVSAKLEPFRAEGAQILEERLTTLNAYLSAVQKREEVALAISQATDRAAAAREVARVLGLSEPQGWLIGEMPLDFATQDGLKALEAERHELARRLASQPVASLSPQM